MKSNRWILVVVAVVLFAAVDLAALWYFASAPESGTGQQSAVPSATQQGPAKAGQAARPVPSRPGQVDESNVPKGNPPIPGSLEAKAPPSAADLEALAAKSLEGMFCESAAAAKIDARDFGVSKLTSPALGKPESQGSVVPWGGFPVVVLSVTGNLMEGSFAERVRREAVAQSICSWAAPLVELQPEVAGAKGGFEASQPIRVLLPLKTSATPVPPLTSDEIEEGQAFVGRPVPSGDIKSEDVAAFMDQVRAAGHTPRGRLLVRLDRGKTGMSRTETAQFIQPVASP